MSFPKLFFDNRFADGTPVASTTAAGDFNASNVADMRAYTWWKPTALPAYVRIDCGAPTASDYAICHGHDLFTQGCTFEVRGSTDNFATSDVLVATKTPTNNAPFLLEFVSVSYRYWEFKITGGATMPSIAIAMIGAKFTMPSHLLVGYDPMSTNAVGQTNFNDNGHPLGRVIDFRQRRKTVSFGTVLQTWVINTFDPVWQSHLSIIPFVFAWDSEAYPTQIHLVAAGDTYNSGFGVAGNAMLSFDMTGVA